MSETLSLFKTILNKQQKRLCTVLVILKISASFLEYIGLSLIIPAVALLSNADLLSQYTFLGPLLNHIELSDPSRLVSDILLLICGIYLLKNLYLTAVDYIKIRFVLKCRLAVQKEIIDGILYAPYLQHAQKTTPELMQSLSSDIHGAFRYLEKILDFCSELAVICVLLLLMAAANLQMTIAAGILFGAVFSILQLFLKPYLSRESMKSHLLSVDFNKWLLQAVSCFKILKAERLEAFFAGKLKETSEDANQREIRTTYVQTLPRIILELVSICGMLLITSIFLRSGTDMSHILTQLTVFALASIRMLPSISRINACLNSFTWNRPLLIRTAAALEAARQASGDHAAPDSIRTAELATVPHAFFPWEQLELKQICFQYPDTSSPVLENLDLTIQRGQMLGIIGLSGAGKTTLIDMILGLLPPQSGQVCVDGKDLFAQSDLMQAWSARVAYIPQSISLLNGTIRENILFGRPDRGDDQIWAALEAAQLSEYVKTLPAALNTPVGEYGLRLSGGQRQRIGIARAFYKQADILVFDEATSALDYGTEEKIIHLIQSWRGSKTSLIITHRLDALHSCDEVIAVSGRKAERWSRIP